MACSSDKDLPARLSASSTTIVNPVQPMIPPPPLSISMSWQTLTSCCAIERCRRTTLPTCRSCERHLVIVEFSPESTSKRSSVSNETGSCVRVRLVHDFLLLQYKPGMRLAKRFSIRPRRGENSRLARPWLSRAFSRRSDPLQDVGYLFASFSILALARGVRRNWHRLTKIDYACYRQLLARSYFGECYSSTPLAANWTKKREPGPHRARGFGSSYVRKSGWQTHTSIHFICELGRSGAMQSASLCKEHEA